MPGPRSLRRPVVRTGLAVAAAVVLATLSPPLVASAHGSACAAGDTWRQFHNDAAKTGWNCAERQISPSNVQRLAPRWAAGGNGVTGSPIVVGPTVVFVSESLTATSDTFSLEAVRRSNGQAIWSTPLADGPLFPPGALAYADGRILLVAGGALQAYRADNGTLAWSKSVGQSRGPTVSGHVAYLGSSDHTVYAVSTTTGTTKWTASLPGEVSSELAVSDGRVFVAAAGELFALGTSSGAVAWHTTIGEVFGGGAAVRGDTVYVAADVPSEGSQGAQLFALSTSNGAQRWSAPAGDDVHSVPAVDDHNVYIGSIAGEVHAYAADTGAPRWVQTVDGEIWSSLASANGVVYFGGDTDHAYALSASSGSVLWTAAPSSELTFAAMGSPAVVGGQVYFAFGNAGLISYRLKAR